MGYPIALNNTTDDLKFLMVLSSDHITGATGVSPTVTILKNGASSFAAPVGAVSELGVGWYRVAANAIDANTLGPLLLHATAATCDPRDDTFSVVNYNPAAVQPFTPAPNATFGTWSARTIIGYAMTLIGAKADAESLSPSEGAFGLMTLNAMLDAWGTQTLTMLTIRRDVFDLVADQSTYTVGQGGDWDIVRPVFVTGAGLIQTTAPTPFELPLSPLTDDAYRAIGLKTQTSTQPTQFYWNPTFSLGEVFLWPTPTDDANQIALYSRVALTGFANLTTEYAFAPGYVEAIWYNLAKRLSTPMGRNLPADVSAMAATSLAAIKRANTRITDLGLDLALLHHGRGPYNILSDTGGGS